MLPSIPNRSGAARVPVLGFGGLERRVGAGNGTLRDMENLTSADAPVLASRPKRKTAAALTSPRGLFACGETLFCCDGTTLYADGEAVAWAEDLPEAAQAAALGDTDKAFAALGERVLIWPDKAMARRRETGETPQSPAAPAPLSGELTEERNAGDGVPYGETWELVPLAVSVTQSCTFADGTYAGVSAAGNTILAADASFDWAAYFRVGDGVTVSGAADPENNKTAVVREIDGNALRFYENTFTVSSTAADVTVTRSVPDLDFLCVQDNRVWGCRGDTICCCKLGDPFNWNVFDGLSTDAWSVETGTPGAFTGCVSFMGYPVFFKADRVFKVYGSRPSNYEVMSSATLGVLPGAHQTLAVAGETLFYLSRAGFVRYNGGYPSAVDAALNAKYTGGASGSDGRRYFVSALRTDNVRELLVFDPESGLWTKEDGLAVNGFANVAGTLYAQTDAANLIVGNAPEPDEADFASGVTFADFDSVKVGRSTYSFASKYPVRLWLRLESAGAVTVQISYNGGVWETAATIPAGVKQARYIPVPIRRCDRFGLKISTTGAWRLYGMEIETRAERTSRKGG